MNILFICSRNQWRSPTAETIFRQLPGLQARSAGTESAARIKVTAKLLVWADLIFVMEKKHRQRLQQKFNGELTNKKVVVLDIPDNYKYMDPELIESIKTSVQPYLEAYIPASEYPTFSHLPNEEAYND